MRHLALIAVALVGTSGCATEHVLRPPTPEQVERINDVVADGRAVVVDYEDSGPVLPLTEGGPKVTLTLRGGAQADFPLVGVSGLTVTGHGHARGALIGAAIGAGTELAALGLLIAALRGGFHDPDAPNQDEGCNAQCAEVLFVVAAEGALVGGLIGAFVGTPHHFVFDDPATALKP